jgi:two-component system sensor histidine kinase ChiS
MHITHHILHIVFYRIFFHLLILILITSAILPAQEIKFEHFSTKQGLSQSSVTCICQDNVGLLWLGTYDGLNCYNGYKFKGFKNETYNPNSISHNFIRSILVDRSGNLWIGTFGGGLNRYNRKTEQFIRYQHDPNDSTSISHNSIYTLYEDRSGNLWIGTWGGGLNKLDHTEILKIQKNGTNNIDNKLKFTRLQHDPNNINSLVGDKIAAIYEDKSGVLWIGTRVGLNLYNPKNEQFTHYKHDPNNINSLSENDITAINEDKNGNIWIGTWLQGINKFDLKTKKFIRYQYDQNDINSLGHYMVMYLFKDKIGDLWIGTWGGGLNKLVTAPISEQALNKKRNKKADYFIRYVNDPNDPQSISDNSIYSIYEDQSGVLWIGTDWNGLNKLDKGKTNFIHHQSEPNKPNRLNDNAVFSFYKGQSDILWIGTRNGGINLYDKKNKLYSYYKHDLNNPHGLIDNTVKTIYEDKSGDIWIGTEIGLNKFNPLNKNFIYYDINPRDPTGTNIFTILEDSFKNLWIGNYGAGLIKFNLIDKIIKHYKHNPDDSLSISDDIIWSIHEDRQKNLWIGANSGGLNLYDRENDCFYHIVHNPDNPNSISNNKILIIFEDHAGNLWFGTTAGLNRLIKKSDPPSFVCYTTKDGLTSNTIHGIVEDDNKNLWITTNNGLSMFNVISNSFYNYDISDGLQDNEFNVNACLKDKDTGEIYLGGINGFNIFHPDSIKSNMVIPPVIINNFKIFNKTIPIGKEINGNIILKESIIETDEITLSYTDNVFSIEFAALHFNSPENNLYAYKLDGFEKDWNKVSADQRVATYTNLDPGEYIFRVKASNNDGVWNNEGTALKVIITPPYWQTWWFRIGLIIFLILIALFIHYYRIYNLQTTRRLLESQVSERTAALKQYTEELEQFTYAASHDLRTPLRAMDGFSQALIDEYYNVLDDKGRDYLKRIRRGSQRMGNLIDDLLKLSRLGRSEMHYSEVNLSQLVKSIADEFKKTDPSRKVEFKIRKNLYVKGDPSLLGVMLRNLIDNSWKFTSKSDNALIEFGTMIKNKKNVFYIKDNGVGFNTVYSEKLFEVFHRQHSEFAGTGIGLATVKRIIHRHGGRIWAEGEVNKGAVFYFII